jgi:hypothetical protein
MLVYTSTSTRAFSHASLQQQLQTFHAIYWNVLALLLCLPFRATAGHMVNGSNRPWGQAGYVNGPRMGHMPHQHHTCVGSAPFGYGNAHGYNCIHGYQCNAGYTLAPGYMYSSPNGYSSPNLANLRLPQAGPVAGTNNSPRRGKTWQQGGQGKPSNRRRPAAQGAVTATTQVRVLWPSGPCCDTLLPQFWQCIHILWGICGQGLQLLALATMSLSASNRTGRSGRLVCLPAVQ